MKFYRYDIVRGEISDLSQVRLTEYELDKETPRGYWIKRWGIRKFILKSKGRKRFAYPTKEEALRSLEMRTKRRMQILNSQIAVCKVGLYKIERMKLGG